MIKITTKMNSILKGEVTKYGLTAREADTMRVRV